jgi:hypothetical protein
MHDSKKARLPRDSRAPFNYFLAASSQQASLWTQQAFVAATVFTAFAAFASQQASCVLQQQSAASQQGISPVQQGSSGPQQFAAQSPQKSAHDVPVFVLA